MTGNTNVGLTPQMMQVIKFVAKQANISEELAVSRIFAIAEVVYLHTDDADIFIEDSHNKVKVSSIR